MKYLIVSSTALVALALSACEKKEVVVVPEPGALCVVGLMGLAMRRRHAR